MLHLSPHRPAIVRSLAFYAVVFLSITAAPRAWAQDTQAEDAPAQDAQAQERDVDAAGRSYVSDQLEITLRRGPGTEFGIVRMLKSGTPVKVVEDDGKGYARVSTEDGATGWVLTRFLQNEPAARERLAANARRMQSMRQEAEQLEQELSGMQQLREELSRSETEKEALRTELEEVKTLAAESLTINAENKLLKQQLQEAEEEQVQLREQNRELGEQTEQTWFLIGGGVILVGMLIGLIIPKIHWKRRRRSMGGGINIDF